ncbi:hypothetical protein [Quadrisphaera setariae]|uniref:DUF222 domain-containing protein n=1 Tax=Quadrisphaera setariae TaxID=2593304 RepID=A0A5C8Z352_9ACTN|nr:hypothetical protein [Quadrisphaera setariae]TXR51689.1 hypothetical protein FMM08_21955 [Quadrisphaera setariae]
MLRIAGRTATALVGLARQLTDLPAAEAALVRGQMSPAQLRELATVCRRLPEGPAGQRARSLVEARAVSAAATLSRARLAHVLQEAALAADPGYAARSMAAGIAERDVVLRPSPVPGCKRVVADLEAADAARVWQVIAQIAANAKDGDTYATDSTDSDDGQSEQQQQDQRTAAQMRADVLVSLVVGDFSPTPELVATALGMPVPTTVPSADRTADPETAFADAGTTPDDDTAPEDDDEDSGEGGEQVPVSGLAPDTRALVRIPTPEQRARLSEVHIVVFADDLADDHGGEESDGDLDGTGGPDAPEGPGEGPEGGLAGEGSPPRPQGGAPTPADSDHPSRAPDPEGTSVTPLAAPPTAPPPGPAPSAPCPPSPQGRERPRLTTAQPTTGITDPTGEPSGTGTGAGTGHPAGPAGAGARLRAARRTRAARRALAGYGPFGYIPGTGRLAPDITRAAIRAARWRRLVADPATGVLLHRSRWTLPAPDHLPWASSDGAGGRRSTAEHLGVLLDQHAAPHPTGPHDPNDPANPATRIEVTYRPSMLLAAHVRSRDGVCISPVCHHPTRAGATQLDHTTAWGPATPTRRRGGLTEAGNLGCICQRWHTAKTHGDWTLHQPTPGSFTWTSPSGRVYHRRSTPLLPDLADLLDLA